MNLKKFDIIIVLIIICFVVFAPMISPQIENSIWFLISVLAVLLLTLLYFLYLLNIFKKKKRIWGVIMMLIGVIPFCLLQSMIQTESQFLFSLPSILVYINIMIFVLPLGIGLGCILDSFF